MKILFFVGFFLCNLASASVLSRITKNQIESFLGKYLLQSGPSEDRDCHRILTVSLDQHDLKRGQVTLVFKGASTLDEYNMEIVPMLNHEVPHPTSDHPNGSIGYTTKVTTLNGNAKIDQLAVTRRNGRIQYLEQINITTTAHTLEISRSTTIRHRETVTCRYFRD